MTHEVLEKALRSLGDPEQATQLRRFFKTGKGQYGEGDRFLGIKVPETRRVAKAFADLPLSEIDPLLASPLHEVRLAGFLILVHKYEKGDEAEKRKIYDYYLVHMKAANNWDLVDLSAPKIVGAYMRTHIAERKYLRALARSTNLWERRIAMVSTFAFICVGESKDAIEIATMLLPDEHDLIRKAVGWMLREVGKRVSREDLRRFLDAYACSMPRTTLRYALEHFTPAEKKKYMDMKTTSVV